MKLCRNQERRSLTLMLFLKSRYSSVNGNVLKSCSSIDDDYLQNASSILEKLKDHYRQGGESSNLSKVLQDYTQVLH